MSDDGRETIFGELTEVIKKIGRETGAQQFKLMLDKSLMSQLRAFEEATHLEVHGVDVQRVDTTTVGQAGTSSQLLRVEADVRVPGGEE